MVIAESAMLGNVLKRGGLVIFGNVDQRLFYRFCHYRFGFEAVFLVPIAEDSGKYPQNIGAYYKLVCRGVTSPFVENFAG